MGVGEVRLPLPVYVCTIGRTVSVGVNGRVKDLEGTRALDELRTPVTGMSGLGSPTCSLQKSPTSTRSSSSKKPKRPSTALVACGVSICCTKPVLVRLH